MGRQGQMTSQLLRECLQPSLVVSQNLLHSSERLEEQPYGLQKEAEQVYEVKQVIIK